MSFKKTADTLSKGAHTLERDFYTSSQILNDEYKKIFQSQWICVGRSEELTTVGQYKTINLGNESVIILKDEKETIKAHYNVCRHRGTRICNESNGKFSKSIQCGYHGWTYALDGKLVGAPHMNSVENFNKDDYSLFPIHIKEWEGFIFINLSDDLEDFDKTFSPIKGRFSNWNISDLKTLETKEYEVKGNWKLVIQNYCEC